MNRDEVCRTYTLIMLGGKGCSGDDDFLAPKEEET